MIAVIDVCGNNLTSLGNALTRLELNYVLTHHPDVIQSASQVILPGVGTAAVAMQALQKYNLITLIQSLTQPLLGICVGMQILFDYSEEGDVDCLGLIPGIVRKMQLKPGYPIPHMGWNRLHWQSTQMQSEFFYFVHGFAAAVSECTLATCEYSDEFSAVVQRNNVTGIQFHPEKSSKQGLQLLRQFLTTESLC